MARYENRENGSRKGGNYNGYSECQTIQSGPLEILQTVWKLSTYVRVRWNAACGSPLCAV